MPFPAMALPKLREILHNERGKKQHSEPGHEVSFHSPVDHKHHRLLAADVLGRHPRRVMLTHRPHVVPFTIPFADLSISQYSVRLRCLRGERIKLPRKKNFGTRIASRGITSSGEPVNSLAKGAPFSTTSGRSDGSIGS